MLIELGELNLLLDNYGCDLIADTRLIVAISVLLRRPGTLIDTNC